MIRSVLTACLALPFLTVLSVGCQEESAPKNKKPAASAQKPPSTLNQATGSEDRAEQASKPKEAPGGDPVVVSGREDDATATPGTTSTSAAEKACVDQKRYYDPVKELCTTYTLLAITCTKEYILSAENTLLTQGQKDYYAAKLANELVDYKVKYCMDDTVNKEYRFAAWKDTPTELAVDYYIVTHQ